MKLKSLTIWIRSINHTFENVIGYIITTNFFENAHLLVNMNESPEKKKIQ